MEGSGVPADVRALQAARFHAARQLAQRSASSSSSPPQQPLVESLGPTALVSSSPCFAGGVGPPAATKANRGFAPNPAGAPSFSDWLASQPAATASGPAPATGASVEMK